MYFFLSNIIYLEQVSQFSQFLTYNLTLMDEIRFRKSTSDAYSHMYWKYLDQGEFSERSKKIKIQKIKILLLFPSLGCNIFFALRSNATPMLYLSLIFANATTRSISSYMYEY